MSGEGLLYVLNEREQWFRKLYNSDEGKFLAQPMTYGEYEQIIETHPEYLDLRDFSEEQWLTARSIMNIPTVQRCPMRAAILLW